MEAIGDSDTVLLIIERRQIEAALTDMRAERDTLQQTLLDLITQIDSAKVDIEDIEAEQQTRQRLLEALRLEGERLTTRQSEAEAALGPAEEAVFAAQTETEALRIEAEALQDAVTSSRADRDRVLDAIASFGASVEASGQVLINGDPITAEAAVDTLRRTLEREQQARDQLVELQTQLEAVSAEREAIETWAEVLARRFAHIPTLGLRGLLHHGPDGSLEAFLEGLDEEFADELRQALDRGVNKNSRKRAAGS